MRLVTAGMFAMVLAPAVAQGCTASATPCAHTSDCTGGEQCLFKMGDCNAHGECRTVPDTSSGGCGGQRSCPGNAYSVCGCNGETVGVQGCFPDGYATGPTPGTSPGTCANADSGADAGAQTDGGTDANDDATLDASDAEAGEVDAGPVTCTALGGSSSGEGPGPDGSFCSNHEMEWTETCSDGTRYVADCYCLTCGRSHCCCSNSDAGCGTYDGEGGVAATCASFQSAAGAAAICGFPVVADQ